MIESGFVSIKLYYSVIDLLIGISENYMSSI